MPGVIGYTLTLSGAIQNLSAAFPADVVDPVNKADLDPPLRAIWFQGEKANTNDVFLGGSNQATTLKGSSPINYSFRVDPGDTAPPIIIGSFDSGGTKFSDWYVIGTAGEKLCFGGNVF